MRHYGIHTLEACGEAVPQQKTPHLAKHFVSASLLSPFDNLLPDAELLLPAVQRELRVLRVLKYCVNATSEESFQVYTHTHTHTHTHTQ